jgi:hypothetical protein
MAQIQLFAVQIQLFAAKIPLFSGQIRWKNPQGPPRYLYDDLSQTLDLTDQQTLLQVMEDLSLVKGNGKP